MRCLVFSDIHGNVESLNALLNDAGKVDQYWCLGDIVGFGPNPEECINILRELENLLCVKGNHDWMVVNNIDMREFSEKVHFSTLWTRDHISSDNLNFLNEFPEKVVEGEFTLVHGSPRDPIWEYINSSSTASENFEYFHTQYCLIGHTHIPRIFQEGIKENQLLNITIDKPIKLDNDRLFINPGSIGLPRDGDMRACYMILDTYSNIVEFRRVPYSFSTTRRKMHDAGIFRFWPRNNNYGSL